MKTHLKSMTLTELSQVFKDLGQPAFRAKQVYTWLHKGVRSYDEMTNLPKQLRDTLAQQYPIDAPEVIRRQESQKDGTIKYLWRLSDGNCVETVLMRYHYGNTVCISTEVGCRMGCAFCASTLGGLVRRLEPYEMLDQVLFTQVDSGLPIGHIVLMGIGEPLDNYENVMRFLELVNSPEGMNISMRHISLSTCGLVPGIDRLAQEKLQLTLSVSLHAPTDEIRNTIMPVNKAYPTEELLDACRRYYAVTGRRISFEYAMINGVNDTPEAAKILLKRLKGMGAHMNLIPLNHVEESPLKPSTRQAVQTFQKILEDGGIPATVRRTLGGDIDASCGQLRRNYTKETNQNQGKE
jgi:23S rRNA (adenine2503-C2)-methyltransferase